MTAPPPTQPIPDNIAEACALLSAAERHTEHGSTLNEQLTAGDMLDILTDIEPPYPPPDTSRPTESLTQLAPRVIAALERELDTEPPPADQLRLAHVIGTLRQPLA